MGPRHVLLLGAFVVQLVTAAVTKGNGKKEDKTTRVVLIPRTTILKNHYLQECCEICGQESSKSMLLAV